MLALAALLVQAAPADCDDFARRIAEPMPITVRAISAAQLRGDPGAAAAPLPPARSETAIGDLVYQGAGIEMRSTDPRFASISVSGEQAFRHACGYPIAWPTAWNVFDRKVDRWTMSFDRQRPEMAAPGTARAAEAGAVPVLEGHRAGPTWPVYYPDFFLGVMYPEGDPGWSVIVAFPNRPGRVPARVLARVAMRIEGFSVLPDLHRQVRNLDLVERTADGALRHVVLALTDERRATLAAALAR